MNQGNDCIKQREKDRKGNGKQNLHCIRRTTGIKGLERQWQTVLTWYEEEEYDDPHSKDNSSGDEEGQTPVCLHEVGGNDGAQDITQRGVGVPDTHHQTTTAGKR